MEKDSSYYTFEDESFVMKIISYSPSSFIQWGMQFQKWGKPLIFFAIFMVCHSEKFSSLPNRSLSIFSFLSSGPRFYFLPYYCYWYYHHYYYYFIWHSKFVHFLRNKQKKCRGSVTKRKNSHEFSLLLGKQQRWIYIVFQVEQK